MTVDAASFLVASALDERAQAIDPARARPWPEPPVHGDTVWMGAADAEGRMVSYIQSVYWEFGSGIVLADTGVGWQNRGSSFLLDPRSHLALARGQEALPHPQPGPSRAFPTGAAWCTATWAATASPRARPAVFSRFAMFGDDPAAGRDQAPVAAGPHLGDDEREPQGGIAPRPGGDRAAARRGPRRGGDRAFLGFRRPRGRAGPKRRGRHLGRGRSALGRDGWRGSRRGRSPRQDTPGSLSESGLRTGQKGDNCCPFRLGCAMPSRNRRVALGAAFAVVVLAAAFVGWRFLRAESVPFATVESGRVPVRVSGPGTVQARVPVTLSSRVTAAVVSVSADVGDRVKAGQVLVTLDDRDLSARRAAIGGQQQSLDQQVEAARAGVARAKADLDLATIKQQRDEELLRTRLRLPGRARRLRRRIARPAGRPRQRARDPRCPRGRRGDPVARSPRTPIPAVVHPHRERRWMPSSPSASRSPAPRSSPGTPILRWSIRHAVGRDARGRVGGRARAARDRRRSIRLRSGETFAGKVARIAMPVRRRHARARRHVAFDSPAERFRDRPGSRGSIDTGRHARACSCRLEALTRDREGPRGRAEGGGGDVTRFRRSPPARCGRAHVHDRQGLACRGRRRRGRRRRGPGRLAGEAPTRPTAR
jgi:HlyD family secretion protein